jgi:lactoylglutathione lyase
MKEITRINHVGLRVSNLDVSRAFYEQLGFVFIVGPIGPEPVAVMEHPSGININFILNASSKNTTNILMDAPEKYAGYTHIALEVTDLDSIQEKLGKMNIPITEGPITVPGGALLMFIRDPDGNVIEFHKSSANSTHKCDTTYAT